MKIEGPFPKQYKMRDGRIATVVSISHKRPPAERVLFFVESSDPLISEPISLRCYISGTFFMGSKTYLDLIEEIPNV